MADKFTVAAIRDLSMPFSPYTNNNMRFYLSMLPHDWHGYRYFIYPAIVKVVSS